MEVKAIRDLAQLSDADLFREVAIGLELVARNVSRLYDGTKALEDQKQFHAAKVLAKIAEEEAAKFLILLDAIRCPRGNGQMLAAHLRRFNNHLAKGLYVKAYNYRPGTLEQLQEYVDLDRKEFYLDGPNGVDWIFRNEVIDGREGAFYVDYVRHDDGHRWADPAEFEDLMHGGPVPSVVSIVRSLHAVGIAAPEALATVAEVWRRNSSEYTSWIECRELNRATLEALDSRGQLKEQPMEMYAEIVKEWQMPMYALEMSMIAVDKETLRERQRNWGPDDY